MKTHALKDNDIYLEGGQIAIVEDGEEVGQTIKTRLSFFQGESFYNQNYGVPYWSMLRTPDTVDALNLIMKRTIDGTLGVTSIVDFQSEFDRVNRSYKVKATVNTEYNTVATVSQNYEY